jgi:DnaK suppressor protein
MHHLTEPQIAALKQLLLDERAAILARAGEFVRDSAAFAMDTGDHQDLAASEASRALSQGLASHERRRLSEVDAALARIHARTFGICEATGDEIPFPRLHSRPTARYTVEAQEEAEAEAKAEAEAEDPAAY